MANHPKLAHDWLVFGVYVLETTLPGAASRDPHPAHRLALPVGIRVRAAHGDEQIGPPHRSGLPAHRRRPGRCGLGPFEAALVRACDELRNDSFISDATWNALSASYTKEQLMDLIFTVGEYHIVSMALNTLAVQLDPGFEGYGRFGGR
jgi:4-carboxymuconolactone decarboxylase